MMKKFGVLCDYNGVIANDDRLHYRAYADTVAKYGVTLTDDLHTKYIQGREGVEALQEIKNLFPEQLGEVSVEQLLQDKAVRYSALVSGISILYPGIKELLAELSSEYRLGLVTSSERKLIEPILKREQILDMFDCIISADNTERGKPNPEAYLKGLQALGLSPEKAVAIEDTPLGVSAAKAAGLKCIAVEHTVPRAKLAEADIVVGQIRAINSQLIQQLLSDEL